MTNRPPQKQLADMRLGEPVEDWLRARRAEGLSWEVIAFQFRDAAGFAATSTTLSRWAAETNGHNGDRSNRRSA